MEKAINYFVCYFYIIIYLLPSRTPITLTITINPEGSGAITTNPTQPTMDMLVYSSYIDK
jgi:hypothetical protein